jgi:regulator of cell morphogenesis and NO signaling
MGRTESDRILVLLDNIVTTHHQYVRRAIPDISRQLRALVAHGPDRPDLPLVMQTFEDLAQPLLSHLDKEEHLLFPFIREMASAAAESRPLPRGPFGSVVHPLRMMEEEHETALKQLDIMGDLTRRYTATTTSIPGLADTYAALKQFDVDLREHIRKEDHDLFPAALDLEGRFT